MFSQRRFFLEIQLLAWFLWHLWQQKNKTPSTGARIHARVRTPSANTQPSPNSIKPLLHPSESPLKKTFTYKEIFISNETTIDKSAMKQPTTNQDSTPKPIFICTTWTPISQSEDYKTKYRQRKNGTNMPFFHSLGSFPPIYNKERKKIVIREEQQH